MTTQGFSKMAEGKEVHRECFGVERLDQGYAFKVVHPLFRKQNVMEV